jgi:hypothetical protein
MALFVFTTASAPVIGVFFGGWFIDRQVGGFRGPLREKAMR